MLGAGPLSSLCWKDPGVALSEPVSSTRGGANALSRLVSGSARPPGSNRLPGSSRSQGERLSLGFSWRSVGPVLGTLCFNLPPAHAGTALVWAIGSPHVSPSG